MHYVLAVSSPIPAWNAWWYYEIIDLVKNFMNKKRKDTSKKIPITAKAIVKLNAYLHISR